MKKVNRDPFCNGFEHMLWDEMNCSRCIKSPKEKVTDEGLIAYTQGRCAIHRDIELRMISDEPISQRTIDICKMKDCPYRKEHYPARKRAFKSKTAGLPTLF